MMFDIIKTRKEIPKFDTGDQIIITKPGSLLGYHGRVVGVAPRGGYLVYIFGSPLGDYRQFTAGELKRDEHQ